MRLLKFFVVLGLLLIPLQVMADDLSGLMPDTIGEMKRVQLITGAEAQAEVDKLHGKPLPAQASVVARYAMPGSNERPAEVWVSRVESPKEARRQTGQMVHLMYENPRSPFKNPTRIDHGETPVYRFEGMGQAHLIWFHDDLVYWVSSSPRDENSMLQTLCK